MKRRTFIALGAGALAIKSAGAQPRPPIIGFINDSGSNSGPVMIAFLRGLGRHGYISNQTALLMYQQANQYDEAPALAENLIKRGAAIIVTLNSANMALAARDTAKTIPIVFGIAGDPVRLGLVESMEKPGGNMTGVMFSSPAVAIKRAEILNTLAVASKPVGFLTNPANRASQHARADLAAALASSGRALTIYEANSEAEIDAAFAQCARDGVGALAIDDDSRLSRMRDRSIAAAAHHKIPTLYPSREDVIAGGLMSHGDIRAEQMMKLGELTGRVMKGEKPAGIGVARAEKFETVLNAKTEKARGIGIPAELRKAAEVLE